MPNSAQHPTPDRDRTAPIIREPRGRNPEAAGHVEEALKQDDAGVKRAAAFLRTARDEEGKGLVVIERIVARL